MEDKILKQIENEAVKFSKSNYAGSIPDEHLEELSFIAGAKLGLIIRESVDIKMRDNIEIVLPSSTSACEYNVRVKSVAGEILFEHKFYGNSMPLIKESVDVDWKKLRDEYFDEHVQKDTGGYIHITTPAHDLFEWFKSKLSASKNTVSNEGEKYEKVNAVQDESGDWFVIPSELVGQFMQENLNDDMCYSGEFDNKWGQYRTGGDLNLVQLYINPPKENSYGK
jgi:hypothetical protein